MAIPGDRRPLPRHPKNKAGFDWVIQFRFPHGQRDGIFTRPASGTIMTNVAADEEVIFNAARQIADPDARTAYVAKACAADETLRTRVVALLKIHDEQQSFLLSAVTAERLSLDPPMLLTPPGTMIGRYKLLEPIGEGGYGVVFMAEQTTPVQRKVALKIIKAGMDTKQVIARFEAERQALALMDHPNIAKVFDAGITETGRPYFVMELVKGMPITKYCDEHHLPPRARLELFIQVCQAVQHAHQKGIIHRDIKPSNVLVALYDGKPVPKVIDFGVAKATGQQLTDATMFTGFGDVIGTLEYMSPEQAEVNQLDVDTRSDIYSLGIVLYELLTGSTPLERKRVMNAGLLEMLRVVREEEPPKPSMRLSTTEQLASISANRGLEPKKLSGLVKGELDWIAMKALEKDRSRRYETANGLAADVQRYLNDQAVHACPPSARYRARKFARRNKVVLSASGLVLSFLVLLASAVGWTMRQRTARQARVAGQLELILDEVARLEQAEKWSDALIAMRRAETALAAGEAPPAIEARARQALAELNLVEQLEGIRVRSGAIWVTEFHSAAQAEKEYAAAFRQAGIDVDGLPLNETVHRIITQRAIAAALSPALDEWLAVRIMAKNREVRSLDKDEPSTRRLIDVLRVADPDPWRQRMREAMARRDQSALTNLVSAVDLDRQPAPTSTLLYSALWASGKTRERQLILRRAQWKYPADYWINLRLGTDLIWPESLDDARDGIGYLRVAVGLQPQSAHAVTLLGLGYRHLGQFDQAIECFRRGIELAPNYWTGYINLGVALEQKGSHEQAIAALERAIQLSPGRATEAYAELSMIYSNCPEARLRNLGRAGELAERAIAIEPEASNHWTACGIARYRESRWQEARIALDKSLQLGTDSWGGTLRWAEAIDWFFVAMSNWQLGQHDEARRCYHQALQRIEKPQNWQTDVERLRHFRAEAEELLIVAEHRPTTKAESSDVTKQSGR
jgi:tetratricopeptide (TPR) repeat protein